MRKTLEVNRKHNIFKDLGDHRWNVLSVITNLKVSKENERQKLAVRYLVRVSISGPRKSRAEIFFQLVDQAFSGAVNDAAQFRVLSWKVFCILSNNMYILMLKCIFEGHFVYIMCGGPRTQKNGHPCTISDISFAYLRVCRHLRCWTSRHRSALSKCRPRDSSLSNVTTKTLRAKKMLWLHFILF